MAIAYDNSNSAKVDPGTVLSTTLTVSGSNRVLIAGALSNNHDSITGITATKSGSDTAMTFIRKWTKDNGGYIYLYYMINPDTGTNTVKIVNDGTNQFYILAAANYTGAAQSGQPDNSGNNSGSGTTQSIGITSVADNCWHICIAHGDNENLIAGSGTTVRNTQQNLCIADNNAPINPAGTNTMFFSSATGSNQTWEIGDMTLAPVSTPTSYEFYVELV